MAKIPNQAPNNQGGKHQDVSRLKPEDFKRADLASHQVNSNLLLKGDEEKPEQKIEADFEKIDEGLTSRSPWKLIAGSVVLIAGLIASLTLFNAKKEKAELVNPDEFIAAQQERYASGNSQPRPLEPEDPEELSKTIKTLVANYCSAPSIEERIKFCRQVPDLAEKMTRYHETNPFFTGDVSARFVIIGAVRVVSGITFFRTEVPINQGRRLILPVCQTSEGYRVDWEAAAVYQGAEWEELIGSDQQAKMRVSIDVDTFFVDEFTTKTHLCVRLRAPELEFPCYAYIDRSSQAYLQLAPVIASWRAGKHEPAEVILSISHVKTIRTTQFFVVSETVALSWLDPH